jgi:hypothetical protein
MTDQCSLADLAPTGFQFTRTLNVGAVHCGICLSACLNALDDTIGPHVMARPITPNVLTHCRIVFGHEYFTVRPMLKTLVVHAGVRELPERINAVVDKVARRDQTLILLQRFAADWAFRFATNN